MINKRFISFVFEYCKQNTINYVSELSKGEKKKKWRAEIESTIVIYCTHHFITNAVLQLFMIYLASKHLHLTFILVCINVYGMNYNGTKKKNMHYITKTLFSQADNIGTGTKCPSKKVMSVLLTVKEREQRKVRANA